jgi:hypothetical protein
MGFADVVGAIDAGSPKAAVVAAPKAASSFSGVINSIDTGGNTSTAEPSKAARNIGVTEAFGRGAAQGVTANFSDELSGLTEAGGGDPTLKTGRYGIDHLIVGLAKYLAGNEDARKKYDEVVTREREANQQASEQHPVASMAGSVVGSMALPVGGAAGGASLAARMGTGAALGAGYGALAGAGEGEGAADRATRATTGGLVGGVFGAAAPPLVEGVLRGGEALSAPVVSALRGAVNPENEAARRVVSAVQRDIQADPAARNRLTPQEFVAQRQQGGPAAIIDIGGETTKALARSSANTSPEARSVLNDTINDRFEGQSARVTDWLRQTFHYPDAGAQSAALEQAAKGTNRANYRQAMQEGDREIMSPEIERLMSSPTMVSAMQRASTSGKDRAVTQGLGGFNAGVTVENGVVNFRKGKNGVPTYPNLAFWDATKRELDDMANAAGRAGEKEKAAVVGDLSKTLRAQLDQAVPSYSKARAGAAGFFGAQDALEAGQNFVTSKNG